MGFFISIKEAMELPCCKKKVLGWQSKYVCMRSRLGNLIEVDNGYISMHIEEIDRGAVSNYCDEHKEYWKYEVADGKPGEPVLTPWA